ncbi:zinc ribbon domain-containing protein [Leptothoe kymatousa]|uniref:Zinc ribbon domain-containing protein n=1 Tax=Leptothoe kymatousa TAU-MAC 1615 TaxID=2364775 RepID=A0ABS5Y4H7_9CYAN|nr:zinc ribbon domain-containing protein [Leptothoe kymatousa]MBT9312738.1 zinc ribbon domain-containing protein [Leptothoe kymatousa TAU-MAC 1615]
MAYLCELAPGHRVYLDNQGDQTTITTLMALPGQQQQATSTSTTGVWTAPPTAYQQAGGAIFKIFTAQGETCIYVQGNSISTATSAPSATSQQLSVQLTTEAPPSPPTMEPMSPMTMDKPMAMGNMQMSMNPMEMRMGNMELKMDSMAQPPASPPPQPSAAQQFCTQCGTKVAPEDRFCGHCGHNLKKQN